MGAKVLWVAFSPPLNDDNSPGPQPAEQPGQNNHFPTDGLFHHRLLEEEEDPWSVSLITELYLEKGAKEMKNWRTLYNTHKIVKI